jgi:hypothetical protein
MSSARREDHAASIDALLSNVFAIGMTTSIMLLAISRVGDLFSAFSSLENKYLTYSNNSSFKANKVVSLLWESDHRLARLLSSMIRIKILFDFPARILNVFPDFRIFVSINRDCHRIDLLSRKHSAHSLNLHPLTGAGIIPMMEFVLF